MDQNPAMKLGLAFATLVGVYVTVYWMWTPGGSPAAQSISFAADPADEKSGGTKPVQGKPGQGKPGEIEPGRLLPGADRTLGSHRVGEASATEIRQGGSRPIRPPQAMPDPGKPNPALSGGGATRPPEAGTRDPDKPSMQVTPPKFEQYKVQAGDSFESIAKKRYGSSSMHTVIARANPFIDPRRLRPGRVILIPLDPQNIQGKASPTVEASREGWKTHTIVSGDTLSGIAKQYYGTTAYAKRIYEANTDRLRNENDLKLGLELLIPPAPKDENGKGDAGDAGGGASR
ncbi:MAG TPA: LysM peptidoglycan-binding domain-containing protein [Phycisphaerales bacterium]|nr:LysM peptidoglycan-binding domain-containing protein [Phycisphaerales bacterium]